MKWIHYFPQGREMRTEPTQNLAKAAAENDPFWTFVYLFYDQEIAVFHNRITPSSYDWNEDRKGGIKCALKSYKKLQNIWGGNI